MTIITNIMDGIVLLDRAGNLMLLNCVARSRSSRSARRSTGCRVAGSFFAR
jgi:signal transduction histidine kinase